MNYKELYMTDSLDKLDALAKRDDIIHNLKKRHRFTNFAKKILAELLQCQDDQEKCYIFCKRYMKLMAHIDKISDDPIFTRSIYLSDTRKVEQLIDEIRSSLEERYKKLSKENSKVISPLNSPTNIIPQTNHVDVGDSKVFKDKFISPADLFSILQKEKNFLLVDIRPQAEYQSCRVSVKQGEIINIPGELIETGLSAHTLGQLLPNSIQNVWERRDKYDIIIFMDNDTQKYNYVGSKLERLRSFIVEWDILRSYKQEPVVLNGGLKEFVDWYPFNVENYEVLLCQTNSEIDELLDLETIIYPESGSIKQMNLKIHAINSINNLEDRVKRDFENGEVPQTFQSLSEGDLPLDFYNSKENIPASPYKSLSEESLRKDKLKPEPDVLFPPSSEGEQVHKPSTEINEAAEIKELLEGDKAALLRQARASKPKFTNGESQEDKGDRRRERSEDDRGSRGRNSKLKDKEANYRDRSPFVKPPTIERSLKPNLMVGDGFTGLRNVKNICYMNCLLQCLKVIPILKSIYVTTDRYKNYTTRTPPKLNAELAQVLREIWGGTYQKHKIFLIQKFKDRLCEFAPMYDRNTHEDCFEFFMFLFNAVSEDCSVDLPRLKMMTESEKAWYGHLQGRTSVWVDNFYYQLKNTKSCANCRKVNFSFETDSTLMLPVSTRTGYLQDMITEYLRENRLTDFSCANCKSTGTILNKKELAVEPEVLVVVLKRYIANADGTFRKNETEVGFPLTNLKFGNSKYNLYGVVQHSGGMTFGHYFATVLLNDKKDTWVLFNDESITVYSCPINELSNIKSSAAGFFYVRNTK